MADPISTWNSSDTLEQARAKVNANAAARHDFDWTTVADADHTVVAGNEAIAITATTAARTVNLLAANSADARPLVIYADAADVTNTVTVDGNGADTIGGSATQVLDANNEWIRIYPDGTSNWRIIGDSR